jgi:uncharacterized protein YbaP (TraB family)
MRWTFVRSFNRLAVLLLTLALLLPCSLLRAVPKARFGAYGFWQIQKPTGSHNAKPSSRKPETPARGSQPLGANPQLPAASPDFHKYPSLLWEISGNGLKRPSYLFGTMHVSSKLVFHLSDSFYVDLRNSEVVALELDPQLWQDQLYRFQNMQTNLRFYTQGAPNNYINQRSFQLEKYDDPLKIALSDEPTIINGLLYRTYQARADFEEDTYLDLYIYQTGKKLGKQATGVENYFQTEKLVMEAAQDMMKDRKKKAPDTDGESAYEIERKTQEAYRKGDLDMLDSLEKLLEPSEAYMEKFLYRRNEIQAASIDSIVRHRSLFVGVGAAHLPGKRGVIELLRSKGYTLRPVTMADRDATLKEDIDKTRVPVSFSPYTSEDGDFSVQLPGKLYRRPDTRWVDSWQYADMSNGAYYLIGRVKTGASFLGQKEESVLKKVDSLLYENIPGKILKKTSIVRNGYKGFDITSRTRRGDVQRYNILVTPGEVLVFKMSGNNAYVDGKEAEQFFSSIVVSPKSPSGWKTYTPPQGGFSIRFPGQPRQHENKFGMDGLPRWEYEATDSASGDAFLVWKKSVQNYRFIEEDTADLALMEESFQQSDWVDRRLDRHMSSYRGYNCLDASYLGKDGSFMRTRFIIKGPHYYFLASHSRNKDKSFTDFFNSLDFVPFHHAAFKDYVDTFLNIRVVTPVIPDIDDGMRDILERATSEEFLSSLPDYNGYWPRAKTALFQDDSTGEAIFISVESFPRYYYPKDTAVFWQDEANEKKLGKDLVIRSKKPFHFDDSLASVAGYRYIFTDTNTSRRIHSWLFRKDNRLFRIYYMDDSLQGGGEFADRFYASLRPLNRQPGPSVFESKLGLFFKDFYSPDSATSKRAREAIANVYFGPAGVRDLLIAIHTLPYNDKDYFETKLKLINELGYIDDSSAVNTVVGGLKKIYEDARDTSTIQNAVFKALAHLKTKAAYDLLKTLIVQDPPVFDNTSDYNYLFEDLGDSLRLAKTLFPDLLQLSTVDDYKDNIRGLLANLVDSSYLKASDYEPWFSQLYFNAKIQWKRQEGRDEKKLQKSDDDYNSTSPTDQSDDDAGEGKSGNDLYDYAVLLLPFYDRNPTISHFFDKLLQSKDASLRLNTAILLIRDNRVVADSIINKLAADDQYRCRLLKELQGIDKVNRFPSAYKSQEALARSQLVATLGDNGPAEIKLVDKRVIHFKQKAGTIYFFKYKMNKEDEWQMGFSGLQPLDPKEVNTADDFVRATGKKLKQNTSAAEQFDQQLKRLLFSKRRSAQSFYQDSPYYGRNDDD